MKKANILLSVFISVIALSIGRAQQPQLILQTGNTGRVDHVDISEDGKYLITSFGSEIVHLWNVRNGNIRDTYRHDGRITDIEFSDTQPYIYVSTATGKIYAWKYLGKQDHFMLSGHTGAVNNLSVSHDGKTLISCGNDSILKIWDLDQRFVKHEFDGMNNPYQKVTVSPDQSLFFAVDRSGNMLIADYQSGKIEFNNSVTKNGIRDIAIIPGHETILLADDKGEIHYVSLNPMKIKHSISAFDSQAFSISVKDSLIIATGRGVKNNIRFFRISKFDSIAEYQQKYIFENPNNQNFIYGIYDHARANDNTLVIPTLDGNLAIYNTRSEKNIKLIRGLATPVNALAEYGSILFFSTSRAIGKYDLDGNDGLSQHPVRVLTRDLSLVNENEILSFDQDNNISLMEPETFDIIRKKPLPKPSSLSGVVYLENSNTLIYRYDDKKVYAENLSTGKIKKLKIDNCTNIQLSNNQKRLVLQSGQESIHIFNTDGLKYTDEIEQSNLRAFAVSEDGGTLAYYVDLPEQKAIILVDIKTMNRAGYITVSDSTIIDRMIYGPDNKWLFTYARSVGKFNQKEDYTISCWDLGLKKMRKRLEGHSGFINDMIISQNHSSMISAGMDGTIRMWSLDSLNNNLIIIPFIEGEWAALTPDGRFDSSPRAMSKIHFTFKNEMLHLDQMKKSFYEPKLVQKALGFMPEPYITNLDDQQFSLFPEIRLLPPQINDGFLGIKLKDQGGGIGPISIRINDKEVVEDIRSFSSFDTTTSQFQYEIAQHPYLKKGSLNKITVEGYNGTGYPISHKRNVYFIDNRKKSDKSLPHLYAIIVGVSDYKGDLIDLNYAAKDAGDFADAIQMGAENYLGKDHVHIYPLTTDEKDEKAFPSKENIELAFTHISTLASPNDIMLVYLSGHGLDIEDDDEFYYLTADAENPSTDNIAAVKKVALSSSELVHMIKLVPALKQLMIVDACHSGNLVVSSFGADGELNSKSIKALEFMKDRTGTFILASSEGTEVSYESNALNQGLLTYSLLFGMKGAGLHEGEQVDVTSLLHFVNRNVPELASDIGRSQKPVIKMPVKNTSFQIGVLSHAEREQIDIAPPKPIVIRSHFQKDDTFFDEDQVSSRLDYKIRELRQESEQQFIFLDEAQFSNAYSIYGRYAQIEEGYQITYRIFKNNRAIHNETLINKSLVEAINNISKTLLNTISAHQ